MFGFFISHFALEPCTDLDLFPKEEVRILEKIAKSLFSFYCGTVSLPWHPRAMLKARLCLRTDIPAHLQQQTTKNSESAPNQKDMGDLKAALLLKSLKPTGSTHRCSAEQSQLDFPGSRAPRSLTLQRVVKTKNSRSTEILRTIKRKTLKIREQGAT